MPIARHLLLAALIPFSFAPCQERAPTVTVPAYCGYAHPDPRAVQRDTETGAVRSCRGELVFYVATATPGRLTVAVDRLAGAPAQRLKVRLGQVGGKAGVTVFEDAPALQQAAATVFAGMQPDVVGPLRISLQTDDGSVLERIAGLTFSGPAAAGLRAATVERRNAASVHLWHEVPAEIRDDVEWFYCEATPVTDPLWTYYMATGWHRGYFGMQVNSDTERRIIFSVWDSGDEVVDRDKVGEHDRVQLLRKGENVHAGGFGNEGTGGHSHLVHDWQLGDTVRFLVRAQPDGQHTTYTGWFSHLRKGKDEPEPWRLVASFRAPKDGRHLHGLYSFSENFSGANGDRRRECRYGNVWLRPNGGEWQPSPAAKFTFDGHGERHRLDRAGTVDGDCYVLRHGDFVTRPVRRGTRLVAERTGRPPRRLPE